MRELARSFRTEARPNDKGKTGSRDERNEEEEEEERRYEADRAREERLLPPACVLLARERLFPARERYIHRAHLSSIHTCINIDGRRVYASSSSSSVRAQQTRSSLVVIRPRFPRYCDLAAIPRVSTSRFSAFPALPPH